MSAHYSVPLSRHGKCDSDVRLERNGNEIHTAGDDLYVDDAERCLCG